MHAYLRVYICTANKQKERGESARAGDRENGKQDSEREGTPHAERIADNWVGRTGSTAAFT